jgi:signal transduction histidine kinase
MKGVRVYIEEAIANLLANSVKYTPQGGRIDITINDKGRDLLIQIKDTGIGIPKDEIPRLFEEFYRGKNAKKIEKMGTGLGLSIAKEIVDMHNGKIWAESEEGRGSTFYIKLPK